jgi:hypothetical protein
VRKLTHNGIDKIEIIPTEAIDDSWKKSRSKKRKGSVGIPIGIRSKKIVNIEIRVLYPPSAGLDQLSIALATLVGAQKPEL